MEISQDQLMNHMEEQARKYPGFKSISFAGMGGSPENHQERIVLAKYTINDQYASVFCLSRMDAVDLCARFEHKLAVKFEVDLIPADNF